MEQTTGAEEQYWTPIVAGVSEPDEAGQDEPLIDQLVEGVKPVLISHYPLLTSVLYVVIKGLSAASEAHNWLYKRKLNGKYEVLSGLVGTVGSATELSGDLGTKVRYRSPDLTNEMWQQIGLDEIAFAQAPEPAATPTTTGGPALDVIFTLSPSSSRAPAGPAQSQVSGVRSGKNPMAREVQDENLERQIELKREGRDRTTLRRSRRRAPDPPCRKRVQRRPCRHARLPPRAHRGHRT